MPRRTWPKALRYQRPTQQHDFAKYMKQTTKRR